MRQSCLSTGIGCKMGHELRVKSVFGNDLALDQALDAVSS